MERPGRSSMTFSPRLLWLLTAYLLVAVLPVVVHPLFWILVVGGWVAIAMAVVLDAVSLVRSRPRAAVRVPKVVGVGDAAKVGVRLVVRGRSLSGTLRVEVTPPLEPGTDVEVTLPAGASEHQILVVANRRGTGTVAAVWARLEGHLGLLRRVERFAVAGGQVAVAPNLPKVRRLALEHSGVLQQTTGERTSHRVGEAGEFDALEAYVPGMDVRNIDWKASARHMAPRVRRFRLERNQRVITCIDTGRLMADPLDGLQRLDHGVHSALLVGYAAARAGDLVGLHAYGAEPVLYVPPVAGVQHLRRLAQACARLHPEDDETNHVLGLRDLLVRLKRRSLVIIYTEFADSITAELMVETIGYLVQRHLVIFVALDDPALEAPLEAAPRTSESLASAVVAGWLQYDRRRVLRRLGRMGVDVVQAAPGQVALQVVNRYLRVKRRGLIG